MYRTGFFLYLRTETYSLFGGPEFKTDGLRTRGAHTTECAYTPAHVYDGQEAMSSYTPTVT